uniref:Secreted protein n=1 Tax=Fusarium oxysporum (strain Fo5176) TaxID=660025 RepID=A0A0D2XRN7_FUSOF
MFLAALLCLCLWIWDEARGRGLRALSVKTYLRDFILFNKLHATLNMLNPNQCFAQTTIFEPRLNRLIVNRICIPNPTFCGGPKELRDGGPRVLNPAKVSGAAKYQDRQQD